MRTCGRLGASSGLDGPMGKRCHSGITRWSGGPDNRGPHRETYIILLVSPKIIILPLFYIYAQVFCSFTKPILG